MIVRSRSRVRDWKTTPRMRSASLETCDTSKSSIRMRPCCVPYSRVISAKSVLLPAPFRPSMTEKVAGATANVTLSSARRVP